MFAEIQHVRVEHSKPDNGTSDSSESVNIHEGMDHPENVREKAKKLLISHELLIFLFVYFDE